MTSGQLWTGFDSGNHDFLPPNQGPLHAAALEIFRTVSLWVHSGTYPSGPRLCTATCYCWLHMELWKGAPGSPPPTQPPKEGPSGVRSRNKWAWGKHRWVLAIGAIRTFHGRNKKQKVSWGMFSHPSQEQVQRDVPLAYVGSAWHRTRGRSSGADNMGKHWSSHQRKALWDCFFIPPWSQEQ